MSIIIWAISRFGRVGKVFDSLGWGDLGAIGFSAAAWKVGVRDQWIGWDALTREKGLRLIVNNARFLVLPNVR